MALRSKGIKWAMSMICEMVTWCHDWLDTLSEKRVKTYAHDNYTSPTGSSRFYYALYLDHSIQ